MGEQDFQQLYDIAEVAEDRGIPVAVLVERAGDTGSDDYQALADSLMFVVDGNDESDIVHEYENQLGELGSDFWSNHIYVDDVTERVIYGEDVDRFREDILSENPDLDENEAEEEAERMADAEAEMREDLPSYLDEMGYGDEIPSWVSKDYEGAWKRSLSYDLDVIHHDGEMYVFSNNYGVGGTILSGLVGAYIGYKIGRARPQKIGFGTEVRIGNSVKDSIKNKIAKRRASKKKKYETGGGIGFKGLSAKVAKRYEGKKPEAKYRGEYGKRYSKSEAKEVGDKVAGKVYWQQRGRKFEDGGRVGQEIVFDDNGEENTGVIKEIHEITGDYIIDSDDGRTLLAQRDRDVISLGKMRKERAEAPRKRFGFFESGGKTPIQFKGYTINFVRGEYRAESYGNPQFTDKNLAKLKQKINSYLRGGKYAKGGMTEHGLEIGDEIMGYTKKVNELHVVNRKNNDEWHSVDLDDGKRYAGGGGISGLNDLIRG